MMTSTLPVSTFDPASWLRSYYSTRAAFSVAWVAAALTLGKESLAVASVLLVIYPLWDAVANIADAKRNGGLKANPSQTFNMWVSLITAAAVAAALTMSMHAVLGVFGVWASLSGILQLATGVRRWKTSGAQWAMILSGAQSTLAGVFMLHRATAADVMPSVADIAPYAAFGAFYFMVSAVQLWVAAYRSGK